MRVDQFRVQVSFRERLNDRPDDEIYDVFRDVHPDERADADRIKRIDNAFAKLAEVLEKSHRASRLFCGCGDLRIGFGFWHGFRPGSGGH